MRKSELSEPVKQQVAQIAARAGHERIEEEDPARAIDEMLRRQDAQKPEERRFGFSE